jgi:ATP-dependent Clp protease, protease subunit
MTVHAHIPGSWPPEVPDRPGPVPSWPSTPPPSSPPLDPVPPTRVWQAPPGVGQVNVHQQLLGKRIVLASGVLDDDAAARLSAQLLTLDAEGTGPIRLELQNLRAELPAVLTVMGILDVLHAPVHARVSGEIRGPGLGVLVSCPGRSGYPNATFVLTEPKLRFGGTVTAITAQEQQLTRMVDTLYYRLAEVTGHQIDQIRDDARRGRSLTTAQAVGYGLIQAQETGLDRPSGTPGGLR